MDQDTHKKIHRASLLMMASIILSRVIGFFREWVLAQTVGATAMTDVYYASFTIPDILNHLMAAGALSISFIPILSSYLEKGQDEQGKVIFRTISTLMGSLLILLVIVTEIFAGNLATMVAPGFNVEQHALLTTLIRIILPAQFFFYWGGLAISVQYTHGKFLLPALAPIIYNAGIIFFGLAFHKTLGVTGFSIGVLVGCCVSHGVVQWIGVRNLGYPTRPLFTLTDETKIALKRYIWLTIPIMLGFSLVVTDEWITKYFASFMPSKALSWLAYARTEMRIPIAVIGQAAGIASFPYLARLWSRGEFEGYGKTLLREISKIWAAASLATIFILDHALPITHFIYGGGKFTSHDLLSTAKALQMFGLGVFFWSMQMILARGFYACQRTWFPSIVGSVICLLIIPLYWYLSIRLNYLGLALSGSIGIAIYSVILWIFLERHLRKSCPSLSFSNFYKFCGLWVGVLIIGKFLSELIFRYGFYQESRLSAFADIMITLVVLVGLGWIALRTVFKRYTETPLF